MIKENKVFLTIALVLFLVSIVGFVLYAMFGNQLITSMHENGATETLNRIVGVEGVGAQQLEYYLDNMNMVVFRLIGFIFVIFVFLFLIISKEGIAKKWFLCFIVIISLSQFGALINLKDANSLFVDDDHLKYYSMTVENKDSLLEHGTPFGFNHNFQGGIPAFYLRGCFLELIPFALLLGDQIGYKVMTLFFAIMIPISLFFLVLKLTKNEHVARLVSFMAILLPQLKMFFINGMIPAIVSLPLSFLSIFFFLKYIENKKYYLFPLLLFSGLVAYTHAAIFAAMWIFLIIIFILKSSKQKNPSFGLKKIIYFALLNFLICLPLVYTLYSYASFFTTSWVYLTEKTIVGCILTVFFNIRQLIALDNMLFLSILFLIFFYVFGTQNREKKILFRNTLIFSVFILVLVGLKDVPRLEIIIQRISWVFVPFIVIFNLSLFIMLKISRRAKIFGIIILLLILPAKYPLFRAYVTTINGISELDSEIRTFVSPGDYALFENSAHLNPAKPRKAFYRNNYAHWTMYLQKNLNAKLFSHIGEDAHPFNNLRHMYVTSGLYKGEPLEGNEEELVTLLRDWGVNKACVWSPPAKEFFDNNKYFELLGNSKLYTCYVANYEIVPEVRLDKGGVGRIVDETPVSFTVYLQNISEKQTVTINKNYFNFWTAYDENGERIPLRNCNQKICFDAKSNGYVYFKYQKNILLNLIPLLILLFALRTDFLRNKPFHRDTD